MWHALAAAPLFTATALCAGTAAARLVLLVLPPLVAITTPGRRLVFVLVRGVVLVGCGVPAAPRITPPPTAVATHGTPTGPVAGAPSTTATTTATGPTPTTTIGFAVVSAGAAVPAVAVFTAVVPLPVFVDAAVVP